MTILEEQPLTLTIPLREEPAGVLRVGSSRVLLELVIRAFQQGESPETIVHSFDTLDLSDVYAVLSYYLANPRPIDEYLQEREAGARDVQQKIDASQSSREHLRQLIDARAKAKGLRDVEAAE